MDQEFRKDVEAFLRSIPEYSGIAGNHRRLVQYFGYYLTEHLRDSAVTIGRIEECYDAARIKRPANTSDTLRKSHAFVKTGRGLELRRDVFDEISRVFLKDPKRDSVAEMPEGSTVETAGSEERTRTVAVVYGRDENLRRSRFSFLRALKLNPVEWSEATVKTGKATPHVSEILDALFGMAQATVVMFTPDEKTQLRSDLRETSADGKGVWQPRPNVLIEAGMALARDEARTILVHLGTIRTMSDLEGRHVVHLENSAQKRNELIQRLRVAGCKPVADGTDWLHEGDFTLVAH